MNGNRVCLKCGAEMSATDRPGQLWPCPKCSTIHAIMAGEWKIVPSGGKLSDWPEMNAIMNKAMAEFFDQSDE